MGGGGEGGGVVIDRTVGQAGLAGCLDVPQAATRPVSALV